MASNENAASAYGDLQVSSTSEHHGNLQAELLRLRKENQALREREAALHEGWRSDDQFRDIMHRIKNSLSLQSSLLNLQYNSLKDPTARDELAKNRRRNDVVRMAYETVIFKHGLLKTEAGAFLSAVVSNVRDDLAESLTEFKISAAVAKSPDLEVLLKNAIPLGLIVNELATNFFLHCSPRSGNQKHLKVAVRSVDGQLSLTMGNNGIDLPRQVHDLEAKGTLGLLLVRSLVKQVDATFSAEGQEIVITAPMAVLAEGHS